MGLLIGDFLSIILILVVFTQVLLPFAFPKLFSGYFWLFKSPKSKEITNEVDELLFKKQGLKDDSKTILERVAKEAEEAAAIKKKAEDLLN